MIKLLAFYSLSFVKVITLRKPVDLRASDKAGGWPTPWKIRTLDKHARVTLLIYGLVGLEFQCVAPTQWLVSALASKEGPILDIHHE